MGIVRELSNAEFSCQERKKIMQTLILIPFLLRNETLRDNVFVYVPFNNKGDKARRHVHRESFPIQKTKKMINILNPLKAVIRE